MNELTSTHFENPKGDPANIVDGLFEVARAICYLADRLGTGDAATQMGGMEAIAKELKDGLAAIALAMPDGETIIAAIENN